MRDSRRKSRIAPRALVATWCGVLIGACGSSGKAATSSASVDPAVQFSQCMRTHGLPNFPDPGAGGGIEIPPGSGLNPQSPAFQSAQHACRELLPSKGTPPTMSESQRQAAVRFAECMRTHGVPGFPDPTQTAPQGVTRVLVLRGMVFALRSGIDPKSPAFRQATAACGVRLPDRQPSSAQ